MSWSVSTRIPYVVEVCEETFVKLNDLLARVGEGLAEDRIPSQEQECMVVAGLNLLRLQVKHRFYLTLLWIFTCEKP